MAQRKTLTFKPLDPNKMKIIGIIYIVALILFPGVRYSTGSAFHSAGDLIQSTTYWGR